MAFEISNKQTFFNGLLNDSNFRKAENEPLNKKEKKGRTTPRKSNVPNNKAQGKENLTPQPSKVKRPSQKTTKQPLNALATANQKTPNKKAGPDPSKPKRTTKTIPSPRKPTDKKRLTLPEIIVYKDNEGGQTLQQIRKSENGCQVSKSREGRKTLPERPSSAPKRNRHSFNDLPSLKSLHNKTKPSAGGEAPKKRFPKLNPQDPQFAEMLTNLETLFPTVDPEFLKAHFIKFKTSLSETIEFVLLKEKVDDLPTRADYMRRIETERLHKDFFDSFSVENFLKVIPDPWDHFLKVERHNCVRYSGHSFHYLKNKFKKHYIQVIQEALAKNNHSLYLAHKQLNKKNRMIKMRATNRSKAECDAGRPLTFDIQFVHEVAFIENESKIKAHIKKAKAEKQKRFQRARKEGALLECQSCNELSLLPDDAVSCPANHVFCQDCVVKYAEAEVEKNNFQFKCLLKCEEKFSLETLKAALSPGLLDKIIKRNQLEGSITKSAGIEDLMHCPSCYHVILIPPESSVLKCPNVKCLAESCRHCKQPSHIPLRCDELEKFDKTISDENAAPSPPRCIRCSKEFIKSEDSNKMNCPCGAKMCSVCRQPFPECPHFNEPNKESSTGFSCSSEATEFTEVDKVDEIDEVDAGSPDSSTDNLHLLSSGSETF